MPKHVASRAAAALTTALVITTAVAATAATEPTSAPSTAAQHSAVTSSPDRTSTVQRDRCGRLVPKGRRDTWRCTFVDRFDGSALNTRKWHPMDTRRTGFKTGLTCYENSPETIQVRDGELHLTTRDTGSHTWCRNFFTKYVGGGVALVNEKARTYGRYEIRARFPTTRTAGLHGGFWLYPIAHTYGRWPASGEIDVSEWWSLRRRLSLPSIRYSGWGPEDSGWDKCLVKSPSRFHTYTLIWNQQNVRVFVDGIRCWQRSWTPDAPLVAPQPMDKPFRVNLNMGVGGNRGSVAVTSETELPATYVIDYVKVWR